MLRSSMFDAFCARSWLVQQRAAACVRLCVCGLCVLRLVAHLHARLALASIYCALCSWGMLSFPTTIAKVAEPNPAPLCVCVHATSGILYRTRTSQLGVWARTCMRMLWYYSLSYQPPTAALALACGADRTHASPRRPCRRRSPAGRAEPEAPPRAAARDACCICCTHCVACCTLYVVMLHVARCTFVIGRSRRTRSTTSCSAARRNGSSSSSANRSGSSSKMLSQTATKVLRLNLSLSLPPPPLPARPPAQL